MQEESLGSRAQESNWQMVGDSHDENSVDRLQLLQLSEPESDFLFYLFNDRFQLFQRYSFSNVYFLNVCVNYRRVVLGKVLYLAILFGVNISNLP